MSGNVTIKLRLISPGKKGERKTFDFGTISFGKKEENEEKLNYVVCLCKKAYNFISDSFSFLDKKLGRLLQIWPGARATTDVGEIAYFEGNCPDGWEEYLYAKGRFICAAGTYSGTAEDGRVESKTYNSGDTGGEIKHKLIVAESASHNHINGVYKYILQSDCHYTVIATDIGCGTPNLDSESEILSSGGDQPHNNMPPYIVLRACKKGKENVIDLTAYAKISDLGVYAQQSTLNLYAKTTDLSNYSPLSRFEVVEKMVNNLNLTTFTGDILILKSTIIDLKTEQLEIQSTYEDLKQTASKYLLTPSDIAAAYVSKDLYNSGISQLQTNFNQQVAKLTTDNGDFKTENLQLKDDIRSLNESIGQLISALGDANNEIINLTSLISQLKSDSNNNPNGSQNSQSISLAALILTSILIVVVAGIIYKLYKLSDTNRQPQSIFNVYARPQNPQPGNNQHHPQHQSQGQAYID